MKQSTKRLVLALLPLVVLQLTMTGCGGGGGDDGSNSSFTAVETQQIQQLDQAVETVKNSSSSAEMIEKMVNTAKACPGVEKVSKGSYGIKVTMTNGVTTIWDFSPLDKSDIRSSHVPHPTRASRGNNVGTLLYLSPLHDVSHSGIADYSNDYQSLASSANLNFQEIEGSSVSVDALKHLPSADMIIFNTHGGNYDGKVVLATGEDPSANTYLNQYYGDLTGGNPRLVRLHHDWDRNHGGAFRYCITPEFLDYYYGSQKLKRNS